MGAPLLLTYTEVSQYYYLVNGPHGELLLAPRASAPGWTSSLTALGRRPKSVLLGDKRVSRGRVWVVLHARQDLEAHYDVVAVTTDSFKVVDRGVRMSPLRGQDRLGPKAKPDNFEGVPMAGVTWLPERNCWYVANKGKYVGLFKEYYDACNARLKAIDFRDTNPHADDGGPVYPAPPRAWIAEAKGGKVPRGYKRWITYSKEQALYRLQKDGRTVKCSHDLKPLMKEVDKWKAQN